MAKCKLRTTVNSKTCDSFISGGFCEKEEMFRCPLWVEKNGKLSLIGIHKSGKGFRNQGIFYDSERIKLLMEWIKNNFKQTS